MNPLKLALFLLLLLCVNLVQAAQIRVSVNKNPVSLDESFQLVFTADETPDNEPDFSVLEHDFTILNQHHSSQSSWINGKSSKTIQWTLNVMAKKTGSVTIPAIAFGSDLSDPLTLEVTQNQSATTQQDAPLFLEVSASPETPYIQSQVIYTLRLYTRVNIAQAQLNEPELPDAVITKLEEDKNFIEQVKGVDYSVTERKFAIFPQKSGKLTIKPMVLTAEVMTSSGSSFNDFFNTTRTKRVTSKEISLDVKPVPTSFKNNHWLAAEQLTIQQEWSGDVSQMKVGEPLTRTLTLQAQGATVGSLPDLNQTLSDSLKTYPDQPVLKEQKTAEGLTAFRQEKIAIIPSKAGGFILPEIKVTWFNTKTNKIETATVPETKINVQAAATTTTPTPINKPKITTAEPIAESTEEQSVSNWFWVSVVLLLLWLMTLFYMFTRLPKQTSVIFDNTDDLNLKTSIQQLKKACAENNARAAKNALLAWGKLNYGACNLATIADNSDARLRDELELLNQVLYSNTSAVWHGKKLFQAFAENKARANMTTVKQNGLEPLHRLN